MVREKVDRNDVVVEFVRSMRKRCELNRVRQALGAKSVVKSFLNTHMHA